MGYRHFANRWVGSGVAAPFHAGIAATFERGRRQRVDRGTVRYDLAWPSGQGGVDRAMTVIVSLRSQQPDMGIRGIVTAYWWQHPERAAALPAHAY